VLSKPTVLILGAGASQPYGFKTGQAQLDWARSLDVSVLPTEIGPFPRTLVPQLQSALRNTGERSIDAMLRADSPLLPAAKALMARDLLRAERSTIPLGPEKDAYWYRTLYAALPRSTLEEFRRAPVTIYTFNYDRSLDDFLWRALTQAFPLASGVEIAQALDCIGPFHLHGRLGRLCAESPGGEEIIPYGGDLSTGNVTSSDAKAAADQIKLISETTALDEFFMRARDAIASADCVVFLGFAFHPDNLGKFQLQNCLRASTQVFASAYRLTQQQVAHIGTKHGITVTFGHENDDVSRFLGTYPQILD
jgi:hypothetical protein